MAATTTFAASVLVFCFDLVVGYYCDSDKCSDDEYCCGYNLCCTSYKVWDMWYFWCGMLFFIFLLSMCGCFWRNGSRTMLVFGGYSYSPLNQQAPCLPTSASSAQVMPYDQSSHCSFGKVPPHSQPKHPPTTASPPPDYCHIVTHGDRYLH